MTTAGPTSDASRMPAIATDPDGLTTDFRLAMRRLAASVTLITTVHDGQRHGMAATAATSVTTAPPTLLICVNQGASIHRPLLASGRFGLNLLGHEHQALVAPFSGGLAGESRFEHGRWTADRDGIPILDDAQAWLTCRVTGTMAAGSHTIIVGEVGAVRLVGETRPLVYQDGAFVCTAALTTD